MAIIFVAPWHIGTVISIFAALTAKLKVSPKLKAVLAPALLKAKLIASPKLKAKISTKAVP